MQHSQAACSQSSSDSSSSASSSFLSSISSLSSSVYTADTAPDETPTFSLPSPSHSTTSQLRPTSFVTPQHSAQPTAIRHSVPFSSQSYFPQPDPPIILPTDDHNQLTSHPLRAPYELFLNRAPPPADSWIQIETAESEYKLTVRLPGFSREGITLATKRRRILHLVADRWDHGGGHFERRISFGYDADLVHVRAEFDGEMLRVVIPRRLAWSSSRIGYSGIT